MRDITVEDKLRLISAIRLKDQENHSAIKLRQELIKPDVEMVKTGFPYIRLILSLFLVLSILLCDHYHIVIGGFHTDQLFQWISMDFTECIIDWPTRWLSLPKLHLFQP